VLNEEHYLVSHDKICMVYLREEVHTGVFPVVVFSRKYNVPHETIGSIGTNHNVGIQNISIGQDNTRWPVTRKSRDVVF
jgi:hypothetical protein